MEYELLWSGLSLYPLTLSEQAYNDALASYLKLGRESAIRENLELNRLMRESE